MICSMGFVYLLDKTNTKDLLDKIDIKEFVEEQMIRWFERHGVMVFDLLEENFEENNIDESNRCN